LICELAPNYAARCLDFCPAPRSHPAGGERRKTLLERRLCGRVRPPALRGCRGDGGTTGRWGKNAAWCSCHGPHARAGDCWLSPAVGLGALLSSPPRASISPPRIFPTNPPCVVRFGACACAYVGMFVCVGCSFVYEPACVSVCTHVCMYVYVGMCMRVYVVIRVFTIVKVCACTRVCLCFDARLLYEPACVSMCTHMCMYVYARVCMCVCVVIRVCTTVKVCASTSVCMCV
jgi:hypothetical protein